MQVLALLWTSVRCVVRVDWWAALTKQQDKTVGGPGYPVKGEWVGGNLFRVYAGYRFMDGSVLDRPMISDGGSIPALGQIITQADRWGKYAPAFLLHDRHFYADIPGITFEEANHRLYLNLVKIGMPERDAIEIYIVVMREGLPHWGPETYPGEMNDPQVWIKGK